LEAPVEAPALELATPPSQESFTGRATWLEPPLEAPVFDAPASETPPAAEAPPSAPSTGFDPLAAERLAEPEAALTPEELRAIPPAELLSATLGEIFERQGFDEKAIEIYREVVRRHPERGDLLARIEALEARAAGHGPH
jgi:hypothetical protein